MVFSPKKERTIERVIAVLLGRAMDGHAIRDAASDDVPTTSELIRRTVRFSNTRDCFEERVNGSTVLMAKTRVER